MHDPDVIRQLAGFYYQSGHVRVQNARRLRTEGYDGYKKGTELRLTAHSRGELRLLQRLMRKSGFECGKPFAKGKSFRLPLYGKAAVEEFLRAVQAVAPAEPRHRRKLLVLRRTQKVRRRAADHGWQEKQLPDSRRLDDPPI